ncbi:MAG: hypothetical protein RR758_04830 [Burkholderiaceae bacterium]
MAGCIAAPRKIVARMRDSLTDGSRINTLVAMFGQYFGTARPATVFSRPFDPRMTIDLDVTARRPT